MYSTENETPRQRERIRKEEQWQSQSEHREDALSKDLFLNFSVELDWLKKAAKEPVERFSQEVLPA